MLEDEKMNKLVQRQKKITPAGKQSSTANDSSRSQYPFVLSFDTPMTGMDDAQSLDV